MARAVRPPVGDSRKMLRRNQTWRPSLLPFWVAFAASLTFCAVMYRPNHGLLGWFVTVAWSLPVVNALVGLQGALLIRRGARRLRGAPPPAPVIRDRLVVVVPTIGRHDTYPALERSVLSYVEYLPVMFAHVRIDVVTEEGCPATGRIAELARSHPGIRVVEVPAAYRTPNGTRFKARANHYAHELRIAEGEARDDLWVLHMDDDTGVGSDTAAAMARFVHAQRDAADAGRAAKHLAQGILAYPREHAVSRFTWLADAVRPSDDISRFRAVTGTGSPLAGLHGELLLVRASVEAGIGWDFGPRAIVEDAQFALTFCGLHPGRSDWFAGRCYGASPAGVADLLNQRERWAWGLIALCFNREIALRHRLTLCFSVAVWAVGILQHVGVVMLYAWAAGTTNLSPVSAWVAVLWSVTMGFVVWTYWEGLRVNATASADGRRLWWEPAAVVALIPVFAAIEGWGAFRGLVKFLKQEENRFVVIAKPA